jgi:hypothetical protein
LIRIIGIQRNESPSQEFILLQNQGSLRINIRGHLVMSQSALEASDLSFAAHVFGDEALVPPGMYVLLFTGVGESRWTKTKDGSLVYYAYMNRPHSVWDRCSGSISILNTQHTYTERAEPALLMRS